MKHIKNILAVELTSLGVAYQLLNQFVDDETVFAFELSPTTTGSILILFSDKLNELETIDKNIEMNHKSSVLNKEIIMNISEQVIQAYLSQNSPQVLGDIAILELESVAKALQISNRIVQEVCLKILDFRLLRSAINKCIIVFTIETDENNRKIDQSMFNKILSMFAIGVKVEFISSPTQITKSYFEVLKS